MGRVHTTRHLRQQNAPRALDQEPWASDAGDSVGQEVGSGGAAADHNNGLFDDREIYQDQHHHQEPKESAWLQHKQDSAGWDTRATILLTEAIVVTVIVFTILCLCLRKQRRRLTRQRVWTAQQIQEWATIRIQGEGEGEGAVGVTSAGDIGAMSVSSVSRGGRLRVDSGIGGMSVVSSMGGRIRVDSGIGGMSIVSSRDGRIRVDSGISGMAPAVRREDPATSRDSAAEDNGEVSRMSPRDLLLSIPRALGNALLFPLRMLEAGVNDWATENYDEVFLRQFMERLEQEREAAMENPEERETRLKEAFAKECMVWELDEENFKPPSSLFVLSDIEEQNEGDAVKNVIENNGQGVGYGLYPLGKANINDLEDVGNGNTMAEIIQENNKDEREDEEDGKMIDTRRIHEARVGGAAEDRKMKNYRKGTTKDGEEDTVKDGQVCQTESDSNDCVDKTKEEPTTSEEYSGDVTEEKVPNSRRINCDYVTPNDCQTTAEGSSALTSTSTLAHENVVDTSDEATTIEKQTSEVIHEDNAADAAIAEQPSSAPDVVESAAVVTRPRSVSDPTLPSSPVVLSTAMDDTFDPESAPGFLYLNTSGRRRANTGSSYGADVSFGNRAALPSVESMESIAPSAVAASFASQDPHKIPNECAICLCGYEKGDTVVTSCNSECPHAFHQECIVEWLVKMQDGTPCPCCRRQFVELNDHNLRNAGGSGNAAPNTAVTNSNAVDYNTAQDPEASEEVERLRQARRRRHIELGTQRGRAFNMSVISMRAGSNNNRPNETTQDAEEAERLRLERRRHDIELGIRRGGHLIRR